MNAVATRRTLLLALALISTNAGLAHGDDDDDKDHNSASLAVQQGGAKPLADILKQLDGQLGGEIIGLQFKRKDGRYVYKLKVVTPAGALREISVDAATGEILKNKEDD